MRALARLLCIVAAVGVLCFITHCFGDEPPPAAQEYRRLLTREAQSVWGLDAPTAVLGAQVHQESGWRPDVCSRFACGLAQFTPATARAMARLYPRSLGEAAPLSPAWALRALVQYDYDLWQASAYAARACDRWAFALSGYNGGPGWVERDRARCGALGPGCDPDAWWNNVELQSGRGWDAYNENRAYPRRILLKLQFTYALWGGSVSCS